jgi:dihydroorotate dehydrogenase (NAD+) catalytic subunit
MTRWRRRWLPTAMYKSSLSFPLPLLNAAGTLGFSADPRLPLELGQLGAFLTNPVSLLPRTPAHGVRCLPFPGGFLLHTGYPNPGLEGVLRRCASHWNRSPVPVIVHLLGQGIDELASMALRLEMVAGVTGVELGFPKDADRELVQAFIRAACGELPVIARLPVDQAAALAPAALAAGAAAVSLGAPRGTLPIPGGGFVQGRLYGPAIFPQALAAVRSLAQSGIPVIGAGGVYSQAQVEAMQAAGALAVQLDAMLWRTGWQADAT